MGPSVLPALQRVGASGWYILGQECEQFEKAFAQYCKTQFAIGTGNGLDALEIALRVEGLQKGDAVITPPLSAFATTLAIIRAGGKPVFVDVDEDGLLDLQAVEKLLQARSQIRFLLPVHLYGKCVSIEALKRLSDQYGLSVIEDAAQAVGASSKGTPVGGASRIWATSFYPTKNLGGIGDGGALLTDSEELAEKARSLRDYGQKGKYEHHLLGMNSRLDEIQAAILSVHLESLEAMNLRRREIAQSYAQQIQSQHLISLFQGTQLSHLSESSHHLYPVLLKDPAKRASFLSYLDQNGIQGQIHYPFLIPEAAALKDTAFEIEGDLKNARRFVESEVSLPIHPYLTESEVHHVVNVINCWGGE